MNIPKGYKLVPVEPTEEMVYAIATGAHRGDTGKEIWSEALAYAADAAPPQPIYDEAKERELFESWANESYGVAEDEELNMKNPAIKENLNGWLACAQSRAKSLEEAP